MLFSDCSSTVDLLIEYFKRFGDKLCCFWDLAPYLYLNLQETSEREKVMGYSRNTYIKHHLAQINNHWSSYFVNLLAYFIHVLHLHVV